MIELGKKDETFGKESLKNVQISGRPKFFPRLPSENHKVICGYDQGLGERMIVCESLDDMQMLYDKYRAGSALDIKWYVGEDPGFIYIFHQEKGNK